MVIVGSPGATNSVIKVQENVIQEQGENTFTLVQIPNEVKDVELSKTKIVSLIQEEDKKEINYIDVEVEYEEIRNKPKEFNVTTSPLKDENGNILENRFDYLLRVPINVRYEGLRVLLKEGTALKEFIFKGGVTNNHFIEVATFTASTETFVYEQSLPSKTWTIIHPLNRVPKVTTLETGITEVIGSVTFEGLTKVIINFNKAIRGIAYLT